MTPFQTQVIAELRALSRHGLLTPQQQFRATKLLLDHPERIPAHKTPEQVAEMLRDRI